VRDLSLHILDLIENSIRAQASVISVTIEVDPAADSLRIMVEDNGRGLNVSPEEAADPFYTTKSGKRTGLGLSLFRETAEQAGGKMTVGKSDLGGVAVDAEMRLKHVDRIPLGDISATLSSVVCTNPAIDFRLRLRLGDHESFLSAFGLGQELGVGRCGGLSVAQSIMEKIRAQMEPYDALV
jgi:signal transduction histidine kinase